MFRGRPWLRCLSWRPKRPPYKPWPKSITQFKKRRPTFCIWSITGRYTINALRLAREIRPERAAVLGGPAEALAGAVSEALGLPVEVPGESTVANAVGAARSRPNLSADLYADTALGTMSIPALGVSGSIGRDYDLKKAETDILVALKCALAALPEAGPPQVTETENFNQLTGYGRADKIIRVRAQAAPGILGGDTGLGG